MDDQSVLDELLKVASKLGIAVRIEPFETPVAGGGGLCVVRGHPLVLLDSSAPLPARVRALSRALAALEVDAIYIAPVARDLIERHATAISMST